MKVIVVSKVLTCIADDEYAPDAAKNYSVALSEHYCDEQEPLSIKFYFTTADPLTVNEMYQVTAKVDSVTFQRALACEDDDLMLMYGRIVSAKLLTIGD